MKSEFEMSDTSCKHGRDATFEDLESVAKNVETVPSMSPKLNRIGTSRPQWDQNGVSVVEVGYRRGRLSLRECELHD
jgi:hypothetical protein